LAMPRKSGKLCQGIKLAQSKASNKASMPSNVFYVHTFTRQLQSLNCYAEEMPDDEALPVLTEAQLKQIVFHVMPSS